MYYIQKHDWPIVYDINGYLTDDYYIVADYLDNNEGKVYCLNLHVASCKYYDIEWFITDDTAPVR